MNFTTLSSRLLIADVLASPLIVSRAFSYFSCLTRIRTTQSCPGLGRSAPRRGCEDSISRVGAPVIRVDGNEVVWSWPLGRITHEACRLSMSEGLQGRVQAQTKVSHRHR
jgi:hypothetical protein